MSTEIGALDEEEAILHNFVNWTSGNAFIDNLIQQCQLENPVPGKTIEWVPYENFQNIKYIAKGGFGSIYTAMWVNGWIDDWNNETQKFKRSGPSEIALKRLFNSDNPNHNFFEEEDLDTPLLSNNCKSVSFDLKNLSVPKNLDEYIQSGSDGLLILKQIDSGNNLSKNNEVISTKVKSIISSIATENLQSINHDFLKSGLQYMNPKKGHLLEFVV
ncbi:20894_t:CDS:2 [Dentiscutata erythropus]|uniref:20894_t:CDS:1 n=1 Tax=Dentiscutata erythropus TaxID=1348616 RepID=A0A9N9EW43_9GLOM|nr:20894_t:CDS:2 [Dentiscutata erythropus]